MRLIPTLSLSAQYRLTNEAGLSGRAGDGFLSLELSWPLFDAGRRYADADERDALAEAAALDAQARDRRVGVEVRIALTALTTAQAALKQAFDAVDAAEKNAAETSALYREGLATALDASTAAAQRFDAQVALVREQYALVLAYLDLRSALGLDPLGREPSR